MKAAVNWNMMILWFSTMTELGLSVATLCSGKDIVWGFFKYDRYGVL